MYFPAFLADHFPFVRRGESFDPEEDFSCVYGGARPRAFLSKFLPRRREKAWPGSGKLGKGPCSSNHPTAGILETVYFNTGN